MKNYLIVGGSSGIGQTLAQLLAAEGHQVFATYYQHEQEEPVTGIQYHHCNVLEEPLTFEYLPETLDGIAYCPGSIQLKPFHRIKPEDFIADYQLQVIGAVKVLQAVLPRLKKAENSSVILFSTVAVQLGLPFHSLVSASKGALEGLTKALAAEFAPRIRVNAIAPSLTDTPLAASLLNSEEKRSSNAQRHPLKKLGTSSDMAHMAAFLLSDKAGWISGQVFPVDGGMSSLKV
jgi:NAD(P)-dependent dehydrogenase (short-subunit alcohol dehydrogenase family)